MQLSAGKLGSLSVIVIGEIFPPINTLAGLSLLVHEPSSNGPDLSMSPVMIRYPFAIISEWLWKETDPLTIRIALLFIVKSQLSLSDKSPFITSVSLIIRSLVPENERELFTVIKPLMVISYGLMLVWGTAHVGLQLVGVSHAPV